MELILHTCLQAQGFRKRRFQEMLLVCAVPWILTPACKAKFFKVEALMQMQRQVHASSINVGPRTYEVHILSNVPVKSSG
jgi:hypothetical protein